MKSIACGLVVFLSVSVALICGQSGSRQWGKRVPGDRMLDYTIMVNNSLPVPEKSSVYQYNPVGGSNKLPNITAIYAKDNVPGNKGGTVGIISGGVNYPNVALKLTSKPNQRFNFTIEVYGK